MDLYTFSLSYTISICLDAVQDEQIQLEILLKAIFQNFVSTIPSFYPLYLSPIDLSRCNNIIMMNMNELYLEVKGKWKSLYPIYFDQTKTSKQGRRLPKELCIKQPTLEELAKAVCLCQLRNIIQPDKAYSRDYFQMGRLKVQLIAENGKPVHANIPNKSELLRRVGQALKKLRQK